jgi:flagellar hook assembly protein FlgD
VLEPVRPNPVRFGTQLQYRLTSAGQARIRILDARGKRVATLVDAPVGAGLHRVTWSGRDDRGRRCAPGTYFALLEAGGERRTRKLVLAH